MSQSYFSSAQYSSYPGTSSVNDFWKKKIKFYFNEILDIDGDGKVNENDIKSFKEMYRLMKGLDETSSQLRSFSEFLEKWRKAIVGPDKLNKDITFEEFYKYCEDLRSQLIFENSWPYSSHMKEYVDALFIILDYDNDGFVDKADFLNNSANQEDLESRKASWKIIAKSDDYKLNKETFDKLCKQFLTSTNPDEPGNWIFGTFNI